MTPDCSTASATGGTSLVALAMVAASLALVGFGVGGVGAFEARLVVSARLGPRTWVRPALYTLVG
jgi:hypothetical protein